MFSIDMIIINKNILFTYILLVSEELRIIVHVVNDKFYISSSSGIMKNVRSSVTTNLLLIDWTNFVEI